MPNIPKTGAAGQVPFTPGTQPPEGPHEEADVQPTHGADNGYDVPFMWGAKFRAPNDSYPITDTSLPAAPLG